MKKQIKKTLYKMGGACPKHAKKAAQGKYNKKTHIIVEGIPNTRLSYSLKSLTYLKTYINNKYLSTFTKIPL